MERKIVEYRIVLGIGPGSLEDQVATAIKQGWQPLGGPLLTATENPLIGQAVVRYAAPTINSGISIGGVSRPIMDRDYHIFSPEAPPTPITPPPTNAPGWPAPGVYSDPAGGE